MLRSQQYICRAPEERVGEDISFLETTMSPLLQTFWLMDTEYSYALWHFGSGSGTTKVPAVQRDTDSASNWRRALEARQFSQRIPSERRSVLISSKRSSIAEVTTITQENLGLTPAQRAGA
jgi:hypothetical protein